MARPFISRWPFTCACCHEEQPEGVLAAYGEDSMLRNVEPDHTPPEYGSEMAVAGSEDNRRGIEVMPRGKTASDRCDRCFIVHATGQTECY